MAAENADPKGGLAVAVGLDDELEAISGGADVAGANLRAGGGEAVAEHAAAWGAISQATADLVILVDDGRAVGGQRFEELELARLDPLHRLEALEVLGADGGQDADGRAKQATEEGDVAGHPVAELGDEDLVAGLELLADDAGDAHRGVVAAGRAEDRVAGREDRAEELLRAGLAVGTGHGHDGRGEAAELRSGVAQVVPAESLLDRPEQEIRLGDEQGGGGGRVGEQERGVAAQPPGRRRG